MKVQIEIECDNAAFCGEEGECAAEIRRLLGRIRDRCDGLMHDGVIRAEIDGMILRDANGNPVGTVTASK